MKRNIRRAMLTFFVPVKKKQQGHEKAMGFVSDNPSKIDKLERTDYAELLLDKIWATYVEGSQVSRTLKRQ